MSRSKNIEKTKKIRADIIHAAQTIAEQEGWEAVTMRRLSKKIDYTLPVLYHYFHSKDDIVSHVADLGFQELLQAMNAIQAGADMPTTIKKYFTGYIQFATTHPALYEAMYGQYGISSVSEDNPDEGVKLFDVIHTILINAQKAGAHILDTKTETKVLWSMLHGVVDLNFLKRIEQDGSTVENVVDRYVDMIVRTWKMA